MSYKTKDVVIEDKVYFIPNRIKEVSPEMKNKTECYVKVIKKDYENNEKITTKYHLLFLTKIHYQKMRKLEKMFERYFKIERKEKNYIIIEKCIKNIYSYLKECEKMEIVPHDREAFETRFPFINEFLKYDVSANKSYY